MSLFVSWCPPQTKPLLYLVYISQAFAINSSVLKDDTHTVKSFSAGGNRSATEKETIKIFSKYKTTYTSTLLLLNIQH